MVVAVITSFYCTTVTTGVDVQKRDCTTVASLLNDYCTTRASHKPVVQQSCNQSFIAFLHVKPVVYSRSKNEFTRVRARVHTMKLAEKGN